MKITLIAAIGTHNELGKDNKLLWKLSADIKRFKQITTGHCIIMGRKTFDSIGKPLPNRTTIVITSDKTKIMEGVNFVSSLEEALLVTNKHNEDNCFIIGGEQIYRQAIDLADTLDITHVHANFYADVFFPYIDEEKFTKVSVEEFPADEKNEFSYSFITYKNIKK